MVLNGIDRIEEFDSLFLNRRLGLLTAPAGLNRELRSSIDVLGERYDLRRLYAPEHGIRGEQMAGQIVKDSRDLVTGLPVYSLYQEKTRRMTEEMLEGIDTVVVDLQDVGARFYTFLYTMMYAMEACSKFEKEFVVLDRINPLGGRLVEGNRIQERKRSFVGDYPLTIRYGLTIGELAGMMHEEMELDGEFHVVPLEGWKRDMLFPETGRIWVAPSLNLPRFDAALLYPGTCLFEGTNLSEGRGTASPFDTVGAPYVDGRDFAAVMNKMGIPGVKFRPVFFVPTVSKHAGCLCQGVQIHVTDVQALRPVEVGVRMIYALKERYEEFRFLETKEGEALAYVDVLSGDDDMTDESVDVETLLEKYRKDSRQFQERKQKFHLYR